MCIVKRKIKANGKLYNIRVSTYPRSKRMRLSYENNKEKHDITINLNDVYLPQEDITIDPYIDSGVFKSLKKARIIRDICGAFFDSYVEIPIVTLNMGILRKYDNEGVSRHLRKVSDYE